MTTITPYLLYEDCEAAIEWLANAFGFKEELRFVGDGGYVNHAEMELGGATIMLGDPGPDYRGPNRLGGTTMQLYVYIDDVEAHFKRAKAAGATIVKELMDEEYGDRRYDVKDLEGHFWSFAQRVKEVAPEAWGAQTTATT